MSTNKATAADAAKVIIDANKEALVGFDAAKIVATFKTMAEGSNKTESGKTESANAALELCQQAHDVAVLSAAEGCTEIEKGWTKNIKALLPNLAAEGSPFVKVTEAEGKDTRYTLSGYGQNVNSIARGFCQYPELDSQSCESYRDAADLVRARRAEDRSDEEKALAAAKERLTEALKAYRELGIKGDDALRINQYAAGIERSIEIETELDARTLEQDEDATETTDAAQDNGESVAA